MKHVLPSLPFLCKHRAVCPLLTRREWKMLESFSLFSICTEALGSRRSQRGSLALTGLIETDINRPTPPLGDGLVFPRRPSLAFLRPAGLV